MKQTFPSRSFAPPSADRERLSQLSALGLLVSGVLMSAAGFVADPFGEISDSVLWYLAQTLLYAGSVFGVSVYIQTKFAELRSQLLPPAGGAAG